ncbi:DUF2281 domain-containing protein [Floridanema aerugineum]|uniref:DUF2281 domain-containing protein n=1 Tax=Floridaenema aerugineum BLCC-F46 TaxID=3153654 RepID=A0ABV4WZ39_9CYAN
MNTDTALWKAISNMPDALKTELLHYAEYLLEKYPNIPQTNKETEESHGYGSWAGKIIMSDDFDAPLEELELSAFSNIMLS